MSVACPPIQRLRPLPMPANITSIQPGGGAVMHLELQWARLRRAWLRRFRPAYVRRMQQARRGHCADCPHDVIDPRDLKFFQNVCGYAFDALHDRFAWRDRLSLARPALAEILVFAGPCAVLAVVGTWMAWYAALGPAIMAGLVFWFFRDSPRRPPKDDSLVLSPADGRVLDVQEVPDDEFIDGPAVRIGIFLSLFNVHVNRMPLDARVIGLDYRPGTFLPAMRPAAAQANERMSIAIESVRPPHRRLIVQQIAGAVARRIVCTLRPGQVVARGAKVGMIKFGSRTEIVLPMEEGLQLLVRVGTRVKAGTTALARYASEGLTS